MKINNQIKEKWFARLNNDGGIIGIYREDYNAHYSNGVSFKIKPVIIISEKEIKELQGDLKEKIIVPNYSIGLHRIIDEIFKKRFG